MNLLENTQIFKKLIDTSFLKISKEIDLTVNEIRVLLFLYQNEKLDIASDIVEKLMISKSHISFSVESLKNKGYIEKVLDTLNKKKLHLKLTSKAKKVVNLLDNEQNKLKDTLLQNIDEQEKKQLKDTFEKILKNAKNIAK